MQSLIREVAYNRLPRGDRRSKHLAAARVLSTRLDPELAGVVAGHFMGAYEATPDGPERDELIDSAVQALTDAADRAIELHSHEQAMALLDEAIELAPDPDVAAHLRLVGCDSALWHGDVGRGLAYVDGAIAHFASTSDVTGTRRAAAAKSALLNSHYRSPEALAAVEETYRGLDEIEDQAAVEVAAEAARGFSLTNHPGDAIEAADRLLPAAGRLGLDDISLEALVTKATALSQLGRLVESRALFRGVADEAERLGYTRPAGRALNNLAATLYEDDPAQALRLAEELGELTRRTGDFSWILRNAHDIVYPYVADGRYADAERSLDEFTDEERPDVWVNLAAFQRGWIKHLRGPTSPDAVEELIGFLEPFRSDPDPQVASWYLNLVGMLHADLGRWEEAYQYGLQVENAFSLAGLQIAAQAAAWTRNAEWIETIARQCAESPQSSVMLEGYLEAVRLALSGDLAGGSDAFASLIESQSRKQLGSHLTQIRATYAMLIGQDDPGAAQAARDADDWLVRTGTGTLRRLWAAGLPPETQGALAG